MSRTHRRCRTGQTVSILTRCVMLGTPHIYPTKSSMAAPTMSLDDSISRSSSVLSHRMRNPVKDDNYYFENGDCTFLVEGVLFKLHKFMLSRDPESMFCNLFADAQGDDVMPLDDHVGDFRALCWGLYAPPNEIYHLARTVQNIDSSPTSVRKYLGVFSLAHKYILLELERWGWTMARANPFAIPAYLRTCSESELERMLRLAYRCTASAPELADLVESSWITRLRGGGNNGTPTLSYSRALTAGELCSSRKLQTAVYMQLRQKILTGPPIVNPRLGLGIALTPAQMQRLLLGHAMLSNLFNTLRVPQLEGCADHRSCQIAWANVQFDADPAERVRTLGAYACIRRFWNGLAPAPPVLTQEGEEHSAEDASPSRGRAAKRRGKKPRLELVLADYFLGPAEQTTVESETPMPLM
ncbi:F-box domain-containing protein [Mycena kentingensis (nom. inval.)]|nr:F-box domain-containing protein [Mycena kentingensis (nom. inval.)]